jgi:LuxR family transcriptional regulator, maltose regulon positive regulatory protein
MYVSRRILTRGFATTTRHDRAQRRGGTDRRRIQADTGFRPAFPLVEAKLTRPVSSAAIVERQRLIGLLSSASPPAVVAVIAPPGYGKTMLLSDWASRDSRDVAWLTLDDFDNTPSVLLTYIAAALDRVEPVDPSITRSLRAPDTRILASAVPRLASELHRWGRPGVLVLDDAHRLVDPRCLDAVGALIEHLPPGFRVVLAGRTAPDLAFARLRASRLLLEIGRDELAFDTRETEALVAGIGQRITAEEAQVLTERTEGWAAATYLAALGQHRGDPQPVGLSEVSGREGYIAEYLRSELRPSLDDLDVALLTRTSVLDVIEPGLAEHVSGLPDAAERLRRLAHANLLISEFAGGGAEEAFRFHHLFRDHLEGELERREPDAASTLHRRAATWYADAGRSELAVEHALAGGDIETAARLVEATTLRTYLLGHGDRLGRWFDAFDDAVFRARPTLAFGAALVHGLSGRPEAAERMADIVEHSPSDGVPSNGVASYESAQAILRAAMVRHGSQDAFASASAAVAAERPDSPWRTLTLELLAQAHLMRGDPSAADAVLSDAIAAAPVGGSYAFYALALRASLAIARHDWDAAVDYTGESHDRFARMHFEAVASSVLVHAVSARVAIHLGDAARGREELVGAQLARPLASHALPATTIIALLEVARAYLAVGDPAGAGDAVAEAERILRHRHDLGVLGEQLAEVRQRTRGSAQALAGPSTLTPAELRLLPMLSTHLMFQDIAERFGVSRHTIKAQVVSIYGKLGASSRGEAVDMAIELGLLEPFPGLRLTGRPEPD